MVRIGYGEIWKGKGQTERADRKQHNRFMGVLSPVLMTGRYGWCLHFGLKAQSSKSGDSPSISTA
jgi:hypothetical protein